MHPETLDMVLFAFIVAVVLLVGVSFMDAGNQIAKAGECADQRFGEKNWSWAQEPKVGIVNNDTYYPVRSFLDECKSNKTITLNASGGIDV